MSNTPVQTAPPSFRKRLKIAIAVAVGRGLFGLLGASLRIDRKTTPRMEDHRIDGKPLICALWHGPHFPILYAYRNEGICVVASRSADGEILTRILTHFGFTTVRGSSSRGGTRALIDLARAVEAGADAAIAVDGPRGPRYEVKPGIILLAKLTGRPIYPLVAGLSAYWEIHSWDRYRIPKPFARVKIETTQPIFVPSDADDATIERLRSDLQTTLTDMQNDIDTTFQPATSAG